MLAAATTHFSPTLPVKLTSILRDALVH